jgi:allophanate hydrolase subunit 1
MESRIVELGDAALTLEFGDRIDPALHAQVMAARNTLPDLPGITDVVPTYRSLTVHFDPLRLPHDELIASLKKLAEAPLQKSALVGRRWEIPVCFGSEHGADLASVAKATGRCVYS